MYFDTRTSTRAAVLAAAVSLAAAAPSARAITALPNILDLTDPNSTLNVNRAVFTQASVTAAGSGNISAFLRVQGAASGGTETGYNSDFRPVQFDEKTDLTFTHALPLAAVPTVVHNGTVYRQFILDNNEPAAFTKALISLDTFKVFLTGIPNATGVDLNNPSAALGDMVFNLDAGGDNSVLMDANLAQGSGVYDALIEIPEADFLGSSNPYVTILATFGITASSQAGFEEFGVGPVTNPTGVTGVGTVSGSSGGSGGSGGSTGASLGTGAGGLVVAATPVPLPSAAATGLATLALLAGCSMVARRRRPAASR